MAKSNELWVVAFDGALARVWAADEEGRLHERPGDGLDARANSEAARTGGRGEGQPDLHRTGYVEQWTESRFVERVASQLAARADQGEFGRLIVAADPQALGVFRDCAPGALKDRIVAEVAKDHVHTPVKALEAALAEHLPRPRGWPVDEERPRA